MILIVDDKQENIFSLKTLLELHHFTVDTASSGSEALKKILKQSYSLIILDVQMPEMDGFEVAEALSGYSKSKDIPIIFLSALNTHKKFITQGYISGGVDYLTKPIDPDILLLKVKTFYRLSEQTRQLSEMQNSLREEIERRKVAESILEEKVQERTKDLVKANQRLEESNKDLQQFAYIASHDLQEPLRKIETFSNLILERHIADQEKLKAYLSRISGSASRLRRLVDDLLNYSRIYAEERFKFVDLDTVVTEVLSDLEGQPNFSRCEIVTEPLPSIEGDAMQLRRVFQNLISNAIKFSRPENCRITVSSRRVASKSADAPSCENGPYCAISVSDNGIGFNNDYNEKIFDIFQRLNGNRTFEGTGIGLAVVRKVVERHDGIITASGEENQGATFTMVLPIKQKNSSDTI